MQYRRYFIIFLTIITILRLFYIWLGPIDLSPDEAHYWEWSRRLDLSYYSKGPMIAYIIALLTAIGGNNEFSVRIGAVLISVFVSILLYAIAKDIFKSERAGFCAALIPSLTPLYTAGAILMTIDAPFILFWGLGVYVFRKAVIQPPAPNLWHLLGIIIGLGLLTKYTMALIYPCIALFLLFSKSDRFWLMRKEPYIAIVLSIVIFSPVIIWNFQHDWVTIRHTAGQVHVSDGLKISLKDFLEFIGSQFAVITPFIFLGLLFGMWKAGVFGFKNNDRDCLLLFSMAAPVFTFFLLKSIQAKVQANWAAPAYFTAFIAAGGIYERLFFQQKKIWLKLFIVMAITTGIITTIIIHDTRLLNIGNIDLEARHDPTNRLIGWQELGKNVSEVFDEMKKSGDAFIFSDSYQVASELAFYVKGNPITYNVNLGRRMNQYDLWQGFDSNIDKNAVYVKDGDAALDQKVEMAFSDCKKEPTLKIYRNNNLAREFSIFKCYGFKGISETASGKW
ncbi:MAG: glycosyltransferase family 39 protein [Deltaproteobacteria bacterium]|nr:glycosyltransferase family 39 protein [Deltaproteobacteria bacterium]